MDLLFGIKQLYTDGLLLLVPIVCPISHQMDNNSCSNHWLREICLEPECGLRQLVVWVINGARVPSMLGNAFTEIYHLGSTHLGCCWLSDNNPTWALLVLMGH